MKKLFFIIDDETWLEMQIPVKIENLFRWDDTTIILQHKSERYIVCRREMALYVFWELRDCLTNALLGKKLLPNNAPQEVKQYDIGYLYNIYLPSLPGAYSGPFSEIIDEKYNWIGWRYSLWSKTRKMHAWLYENDGQFFIKITPVYRWIFFEPKKNENYYSLETFLKNYKPYLTITVSRKVLQRLRQQAEDLMNIILTNDDKYTIPSRRERPIEK